MRRRQRSSGARALALMVLGVLAVAGYVYGPRYYPKVKEMLGMEEAPTALTTAADPVGRLAGTPLAVPLPTGRVDRGLFVQAMQQTWPLMPAEDRRAMCEQLPSTGLDQAVQDFRAGWDTAAASRQPGLPTPSEEAVAEFITWACDEAGGGG